MNDQLKDLEKTILNIKKHYQLVSTERNQLKQQPSVDPKELATLNSKLDNSYVERDNAKKQLADLDNRYQSLAEAHHMIGEEHDKLQKQLAQVEQKNSSLNQRNQQLEQQNNDLQEKNQLAAERTQVVLNRLTRIDQMES